MREPVVADVMTREVITAVPDTPFRELVGMLLAHALDVIPIIDLAGRPVGVVTEADALTKLEYHCGADPVPLLAGAGCRARWRKASAVTAAELMAAPAPRAAMDASVASALHVLAGDVRRLCVVDGTGRLAGTLTRQDALRLLLRSDSAIQADIERVTLVASAEARHDTAGVTVGVTAGVVTLSGRLRLRSTAESVCRAAHRVPGVVTVHDDLRYDIDDFLIAGL